MPVVLNFQDSASPLMEATFIYAIIFLLTPPHPFLWVIYIVVTILDSIITLTRYYGWFLKNTGATLGFKPWHKQFFFSYYSYFSWIWIPVGSKTIYY